MSQPWEWTDLLYNDYMPEPHGMSIRRPAAGVIPGKQREGLLHAC